MLKTFALTCGYSFDTELIIAEESIFLMQLNIPENVLDIDYYLWSVAESTLINMVPDMGTKKTFKSSSGETIVGRLFDKELRQISNVSFKLKETSSTLFRISQHLMIFQSENDFHAYLAANEPDNSDRLLDIKMSNFSSISSTK